MSNIQYFTYTYHYNEERIPCFHVGVLVEERENDWVIDIPSQQGNDRRYIDKRFTTDFQYEPYTGQVDPHPIWGFTVVN